MEVNAVTQTSCRLLFLNSHFHPHSSPIIQLISSTKQNDSTQRVVLLFTTNRDTCIFFVTKMRSLVLFNSFVDMNTFAYGITYSPHKLYYIGTSCIPYTQMQQADKDYVDTQPRHAASVSRGKEVGQVVHYVWILNFIFHVCINENIYRIRYSKPTIKHKSPIPIDICMINRIHVTGHFRCSRDENSVNTTTK